MGIDLNNKEERNYQAFMNELEKISKKYGIGISGCGCFDFFDEDGFQKIEYSKDSSSGDLRIKNLIFSDGTKAVL
jgi:effector-binding domain-containing protein